MKCDGIPLLIYNVYNDDVYNDDVYNDDVYNDDIYNVYNDDTRVKRSCISCLHEKA